MINPEAMATAINFIETHLQEKISLADIADSVSYSLFHFSRVFNATVHHTPYDYLIRRRLTASADDLLEADKSITEIAFDYQFNNAETYSRAFKRLFLCLPSQWRKMGPSSQWRCLPPITLDHLNQRNPKALMGPTLMDLDQLRLIGLMIRLDGDKGGEIISLWKKLVANFSCKGAAFGLFLYPSVGLADLFYMAAIFNNDIDVTNMPLVEKLIPRQRYASFRCRGSRTLMFDYIFHTWLPQEGETTRPLWVLESYLGKPPNVEDGLEEWTVLVGDRH